MFSDDWLDQGESAPIHPAVKLWAAVLRRAVVEYVLYRDASDIRYRRLGEQAGDWLYDTRSAAFNSVTAVCLYVGFTVPALHEKLDNIDEETVRRFRAMGLT